MTSLKGIKNFFPNDPLLSGAQKISSNQIIIAMNADSNVSTGVRDSGGIVQLPHATLGNIIHGFCTRSTGKIST